MSSVDIDTVLLIVVGAHLRAEANDRPLAYALQESIHQHLHQRFDSTDWPIMPLVCSDVWYLNNESLHDRPAISLGGPGVNGLSAYLYQKLPTALAVEQKLVVQLDLHFEDLRVAIWGVDAEHTANAIDLFESKYLADYIEAVVATP